MATVLHVGVISDTHGLLRPQLVDALHGADRILHAGDVGKPEILQALGEIAPLAAVRGNVDHGLLTQSLPASQVVEVGGVLLYMLHDLAALDLDPYAAGFAAVIYGHSHRPSIERKNGVLYLNPGSAGPPRFSLPVTFAWLLIDADRVDARIVAIGT